MGGGVCVSMQAGRTAVDASNEPRNVTSGLSSGPNQPDICARGVKSFTRPTADILALTGCLRLPPPHPTFPRQHQISNFWLLLQSCDAKNCDCDAGENNNASETDAKLQELVFSPNLSSSISFSLRSASPPLPPSLPSAVDEEHIKWT